LKFDFTAAAARARFKQVGADMADALQNQIDKRWHWLKEKTKTC
jgi:hypothetical protein